MATDACKTRKVKIDDKPLKPSYLVKKGELLQVQKEGFHLVIKVVDLINKRVSAALAEPCYENLTSEEELNKFKDWFIGKSAPERRERGTGRPTKRERRELDDYKHDSTIIDDE